MIRSLLPAPPTYFKACCADVWAHPGIRVLCGEALRPGGTELTRHALDLIGLESGCRVLDLGSGPGITLGLLRGRGLRPVGLDYSLALASESSAIAPSVAADAERSPFRSGSMDAIIMECVLSAVPDKEAAIGEVVRVLRPGGWLMLSDVVVEGILPPPLDAFAGWVACAAGALGAAEYAELLERSGLEVVAREDHGEAMAAMVAQIVRRLALIRAAMRAGVMDFQATGLDETLLDLGEGMAMAAMDAVRSGVLGYLLLVGRNRPSSPAGSPRALPVA